MKLAAGVIVIDTKTQDEPTVLCLRAYNNWDFPKGEIGENEPPMAAAFRELEEETGYKLKDVSLSRLGDYSQIPLSAVYGTGKKKKNVMLIVTALANFDKDPELKVNPELGKPEHDEWRWVKLSELEALLPKHFKKVAKYLNKIEF